MGFADDLDNTLMRSRRLATKSIRVYQVDAGTAAQDLRVRCTSADGGPVHSFQTLLADLATLTKNRVQPKVAGSLPFDMLTTPTALQRRAIELLGVPLRL